MSNVKKLLNIFECQDWKQVLKDFGELTSNSLGIIKEIYIMEPFHVNVSFNIPQN